MANTNTLGGNPFDPNDYSNEDVVRLAQLLKDWCSGAGEPTPASGDAQTGYEHVYVIRDPGGDILYAGNSADPENPNTIAVSASGSASVIWQQNAATIVTSGTFNTPTSSFLALTTTGGKAVLTFSIVAGNGIDITGNTVSIKPSDFAGYSATGRLYLALVNDVLTWVPVGGTC